MGSPAGRDQAGGMRFTLGGYDTRIDRYASFIGEIRA